MSYKALTGNIIYEMKVFLNIDGVFKLFEIVVLANFHDTYLQKSKKGVAIFLFFFCFSRKRSWQNVSYEPLYHRFQYYGIHAKQIERNAAFFSDQFSNLKCCIRCPSHSTWERLKLLDILWRFYHTIVLQATINH